MDDEVKVEKMKMKKKNVNGRFFYSLLANQKGDGK